MKLKKENPNQTKKTLIKQRKLLSNKENPNEIKNVIKENPNETKMLIRTSENVPGVCLRCKYGRFIIALFFFLFISLARIQHCFCQINQHTLY